MHTGTYISGGAHLAFVAWIALGGLLRPASPPVEVQQVSLISTEQFEALLTVEQPPEIVLEPAALTSPDPAPSSPELSEALDAPTSEQVPPSAPDLAPVEDTPSIPERPEPPADIPEVEPELSAPEPQPLVPPAPPRPADRVAPVPVPPAPPDSAPDDVLREEITRSPDAPTEPSPAEAPQEATAPEEAGTELATEANQPDPDDPETPLISSLRPVSRPARAATPDPESALPESVTQEPNPVAQPAPEPEDTPNSTLEAGVNDALASVLGQPEAPSRPAGPPLTQAERDALRVSVSPCWNVGSLSFDALRTTVVVAVDMTPDAKPVTSSIRMLSSTGGTNASAKQAFEAARRAIIRCGGRGFDLPAEKYESWREIEMTFNPETMRTR